jgi:type I restriction enzyme S subunit
MTQYVPGLGEVPDNWAVLPARRVLARQKRPIRTNDEIVTAFRDGQVTLRRLRRNDGFTEALQEIGYHGCRRGDLAVHSMDAFAGAIGVCEADGKMSPVAHLYHPVDDNVDMRYVAYVLRQLALSNYIVSLAKGIRERSTSFDPAMLADVLLPMPPMKEQRRIADFLDNQVGRLNHAAASRDAQAGIEQERFDALLLNAFSSPASQAPLKRSAWWVEGPGIMAAEFRDEGTPVIRLAGVKAATVTLDGCNYVDPHTARARWLHLAVRAGELLISGSGGVRFPVVVPTEVEGAIPYTGLIRVGPREGISRSYLRYFLGSPWFGQQIDQLKTGVGIQHWGPSHLSQVTLPRVDASAQRQTVAVLAKAEERQRRMVAALASHRLLLEERKQALITAALTGQFDVTTARAVA